MEKLFESQGTLGLFLIFFIPGFIALKVYDLLIPGEQRDFSKSLFDAVAYSSLNFAAFFWLIAIVRSGKLTPWQWYPAMFFLLIVMPAVWPFLYLRIRKFPWSLSFSVVPRESGTTFSRRDLSLNLGSLFT